VNPVTVWRLGQGAGRVAVVAGCPGRRGPKRASKLTPELAARIRAWTRRGRRAGGDRRGDGCIDVQRAQRAGPGGASGGWPEAAGMRRQRQACEAGVGEGPGAESYGAAGPGAPGRRAGVARWGMLGEGAVTVFTAGARYPLAGLLTGEKEMEDTGGCRGSRERGVRNSSETGSTSERTLLTLGSWRGRGGRGPRAPPGPAGRAGRVLGMERGAGGQDESAEAGRARPPPEGSGHDQAWPRRHSRGRPDSSGSLRGRARPGLSGTRNVPEDHVARPEVPRPGHGWRHGSRQGRRHGVHGDRRAVSDSLAGELRGCCRIARHRGQAARDGAALTGAGWSQALCADITEAGST